MPACTIVIPCFNEARRLDLRAFIEHATRYNHGFIFVNDGSQDDTAALLDDLCEVDPSVFAVVHLPENQGKAEAVRRGVNHAFAAESPIVGYWDADLATPLAAIQEFYEYLLHNSQVEFLLGSRVRLLGRDIDRRPSRHCLGRAFATVAASVLRLPVYDTQCGAKMFRATPAMRSIFRKPFCTRWLFDVELLARFLQLAQQSGDEMFDHRVHELPLAEWRDVAGSKVKPTDFFRAIWQLGVIHRTYRLERARRPAKSLASGDSGDSRVDVQPVAHMAYVSDAADRHEVAVGNDRGVQHITFSDSASPTEELV